MSADERTVQGVVRILLVEDNRGDVLLVREALRESNLRFELKHLANGEEAFEYARRFGGELIDEPPDLILLDLNLPKHNGWEILEEMRARPALRETPVIILSSSGAPEDLYRASKITGSMYIRKPSNLDDFLAIGKRIENFLTTQRAAL